MQWQGQIRAITHSLSWGSCCNVAVKLPNWFKLCLWAYYFLERTHPHLWPGPGCQTERWEPGAWQGGHAGIHGCVCNTYVVSHCWFQKCAITLLWFQLLRWSAASIMGWALTGGASAAWFTKWRRESLRSEPTESTPARQRWRGGSSRPRRSMEKSSASRWNKSAHWWVHKSDVIEKETYEDMTGTWLFTTAATDQKPKAQAGLPEFRRERRTVASFFQENQFQDAGGGTGGTSIQTWREYIIVFEEDNWRYRELVWLHPFAPCCDFCLWSPGTCTAATCWTSMSFPRWEESLWTRMTKTSTPNSTQAAFPSPGKTRYSHKDLLL